MLERQRIIFKQVMKSNRIGTAGFVLALIAFFLRLVPGLGRILYILGLILSFVGVLKRPRGLAIAGLIISLIGLIVFGAILGGIGVLRGF